MVELAIFNFFQLERCIIVNHYTINKSGTAASCGATVTMVFHSKLYQNENFSGPPYAIFILIFN